MQEDLKKISCWQYILCTNLWVEFISCNARNHDLQQVLFMLINIIRGISHLFPGPRYVPLRLKCVQMLNRLSLSCGVFIPVACMVFDCLEQKTSGSTGTRTKSVKLSSLLKVKTILFYHNFLYLPFGIVHDLWNLVNLS